tara:strand:- start:192 stop:428 length:237 start_codon:yes stop_codon:yes gene_type:complete
MNHKRGNLKTVTHEEIDSAMEKFVNKGGTIKQLHSQFENPNLKYDSIDHEERKMVYEITGFYNSTVKSNNYEMPWVRV